MTHPRFAQHRSFDRPSYVVLRDFGPFGFESVMHPESTRESVVFDIVSKQIDRVVSVVEFNAVEGYSSDITDSIREDVERLVSERAAA